ncbi:VapC toxin family PIN domain ribonuclease [Geodermatophilus sp. TF02-6]|uniref:TA system VapC family ribonuclease toxin n=1 Tax=Geodermatophilus sp. TF02-6 TaxID=2250575 RepID=UPI000DE80063|nr:TA system VapC family ribonuclease toxin [Geodermatophilus sp. TF02-6]RBY75523.1 VapC toxin family PIN domain ribonuclease [Geodermatophilus sp. TF02-6]
MTHLLDTSVLIALGDDQHVHYETVRHWLANSSPSFATCPVTQGALVRHALRRGAKANEATEVLSSVTSDERHEFWPDDLGYGEIDLRGVVGHRQVTDAYLAGLARARSGRLATLDRALALLHPDVALLIEP